MQKKTKEQRDKDKFEERLRMNQAACDMIGAACQSAKPKKKREMKVIMGHDRNGDWAHLSQLTSRPKGAGKYYEVGILCKEPIEVGDLLHPPFSTILGVVEILEHRQTAKGDWSTHKGDPPAYYKLKVADVDIFKAASLAPEIFGAAAAVQKKTDEQEATKKAEEKKFSLKKKRR